MINLLPNDVKTAIRFARINVILIQYCFVSLLAGLLLVGVYFYGLQSITAEQATIENLLEQDQLRLSQLEAENSKAAALASRIDTATEVLENEVKFTEVLAEYASVFPPGAIILSLQLTPEQSGPITLTLRTTDELTLGTAIENIRASELFSFADIASTARKQIGEQSSLIDIQYPVESTISVFLASQEATPADTTTTQPDELSTEGDTQ